MIDGIAVTLEDLGFSVYVDWREDPLMSRTNVTSSTADTIKLRMVRCSYMLYAFSENATNSKWMPWELGYFDGLKNNKIAILPLAKTTNNTTFVGQEYLGLYPVVTQEKMQLGGSSLYLNLPSGRKSLSEWGGKGIKKLDSIFG